MATSTSPENIKSVTEGYNGTIFAYGQTGSGKTFTMQGANEMSKRGVIPRAFDHIFETITISESTKFLIHVSFLEIYQECIRDLLVNEKEKRKLELREHPESGVFVQDLSMTMCKNIKDCNKVMASGWANRATAATLMNEYSSRSHAIFTIHLERIVADKEQNQHIRVAKLNLVDLAGSERQSKAGATGERLKEAAKINLSLSALGNCISALVDGKSTHIPYRDSKLTRILQDSLGGNAKTLMVACLSPADNNYDETLSTLRYANRAKNIKNKPKINEDPKDALLRECLEEIERLKAQLKGEAAMEPKTIIVEKEIFVKDDAALAAETAKIKEEYEAQMAKMRAENESMRKDKAQVEQEMAKLRENYQQKINNVRSVSQMVDARTSNTASYVASVDAKTSNTISRVATIDAKTSNTLSRIGADAAVMVQPSKATINSKIGGEKVIKEDALSSIGSSSTVKITRPEDIKQRLEELEGQMVGGEEAKNEDVIKRRNSRFQHLEEREKQLKEALAEKDGEDIMMAVYDSIQQELRAKSKQLETQKAKNETLEQDMLDLETEFQKEREDYLDSIRKINQQVAWLQGIVDKMHPLVRRDCNYWNLDQVREESLWDEDNEIWIMPKLTTEKVHLPQAVAPPAKQKKVNEPEELSAEDQLEDSRAEDRLRQKLIESSNQEIANKYFQNKNRANQLLSSVENDRKRNIKTQPTSGKTLLNSALAPPDTTQQGKHSHESIKKVKIPTRLDPVIATHKAPVKMLNKQPQSNSQQPALIPDRSSNKSTNSQSENTQSSNESSKSQNAQLSSNKHA